MMYLPDIPPPEFTIEPQPVVIDFGFDEMGLPPMRARTAKQPEQPQATPSGGAGDRDGEA